MITAEQRAARAKYIGASEAPVVMGVDPWRNIGDLWLQKTGKIVDAAPNEAQQLGNIMEAPILDLAALRLGKPLIRNQFHVHRNGMMCASTDAEIRDGDKVLMIIEAKLTGMPEGWGEEGTDEIPENYVVQTAAQQAVIGLVPVIVPVLMPGYRGFDFRMYRVEPVLELINIIEEHCSNFMEKHVRRDIPPENFAPSLEFARRIRRRPENTIEISDDVVDAYIVAKAAVKQAEEECDAAQAQLLTALGESEAAVYSAGRLTFFEQTARRIDAKRLEAEYPGIAAEVRTESTFRVLRIKPNKKGSST